MNSYLQIVSIISSFIYGFIFYYLSIFNKYILLNKNTFIKFIITFIFILDMIFLYIYLIYKLNNGINHPYFILSLLIGYYLGFRCKINVKIKKIINKLRH